jgi:hypothetical protein
MLHGRNATQLGLASTAVLISLLHCLVEEKLLKREAVLALLGEAADELAKISGEGHWGGADIIRKEIVPKV